MWMFLVYNLHKAYMYRNQLFSSVSDIRWLFIWIQSFSIRNEWGFLCPFQTMQAVYNAKIKFNPPFSNRFFRLVMFLFRYFNRCILEYR